MHIRDIKIVFMRCDFNFNYEEVIKEIGKVGDHPFEIFKPK